MNTHFLRILFRNLQRRFFFVSVNVLGMGIAIGCCIVAYFNYEQDAGFDACFPKTQNIFRVSSLRAFENTTTRFAFVPSPLGPVIRHNFPEATAVVRYANSHSSFQVDDDFFDSGLAYADTEFFKLFQFDFLEGNRSALAYKEKVVLTDEMAQKLFGTVKAVGRVVTLTFGDVKKELTVGAIVRKPPVNSSFRGSAWLNYENYWDENKNEMPDDWRFRNTLFIQLINPSRAPEIEKELLNYCKNNNDVRQDFQIKAYEIEKFEGMALRDSKAGTQEIMTAPAGPRSAVIGSAVSAILILLLACLNLTNTTVALSSGRLKEIGIRKVMGSRRDQLVKQFMWETLFVCFLALLAGLQIAEVLVNGWNSLWPYVKLEIHYFDHYYFFGFLVVLLLVTGLLAGSYPAFYISNYDVIHVLKGKVKFGGNNFFTRSLLAIQFGIAIIAVVFAIAFVQNAQYQKNYAVGFDQHGVLFAEVKNYAEFQNYQAALAGNPEIVSTAGSRHNLFFNYHRNEPVRFESSQIETDLMEVGDGYLATMGFTLLDGRDFIRDSQSDRNESVVITESLAQAFHLSAPIGKELIVHDAHLYIVGVLRDVYTRGLWKKMEPMVLRYANPSRYSQIVVRAKPGTLAEVRTFMEKTWKKMFRDRPFLVRAMDEQLMETLKVNDNMVTMFIFMGVVSILLSVTGLFALVSLTLLKRIKEIGVRKVLGATVAHLTWKINREFLALLFFSFFLGGVASYFLVNLLLSAIWHYYLPVEPISFAIAGSLLLITGGSTIFMKVFGAASLNPVDTLKSE